MRNLVLSCFLVILPAYASNTYDDEATEKAKAIFERVPNANSDQNTLVIMQSFNALSETVPHDLEQADTAKCKFVIAIDFDGKVTTTTRMMHVKEECEEAYINLRKVTHINLPEQQSYDAISIVVQVLK